MERRKRVIEAAVCVLLVVVMLCGNSAYAENTIQETVVVEEIK